MAAAVRDIAGRRFGRLTAICIVGRSDRNRGVLWQCQCDCGAFRAARGGDLRSGHILSCGCMRHDKRKDICLRGHSRIAINLNTQGKCKLCNKVFRKSAKWKEYCRVWEATKRWYTRYLPEDLMILTPTGRCAATGREAINPIGLC